jgi:AraC-like DNA-binding protein
MIKKEWRRVMPSSIMPILSQEMPVGRDFEVHHRNFPLPFSNNFHSHDYFEFYFFVSGNVRMIMESNTYPLLPYTVIIMPPGYMHMASVSFPIAYYERFFLYTTRDYLRKLSSHHFDFSDWINSLIKQERYCFHLKPVAFDTCLRIADDIIQSATDDSSSARHINYCRTSTLLGTLAQFTLAEHAQPPIPSTLAGKLIDYINQHLTEHLSLDELAEELFISKYYMLHVFKQHTNTSIYNYIQTKRINNAKELIKAGASPGDACHLCGFGDYAGFYKTFLRKTGVSPREYEKRLKN